MRASSATIGSSRATMRVAEIIKYKMSNMPSEVMMISLRLYMYPMGDIKQLKKIVEEEAMVMSTSSDGA